MIRSWGALVPLLAMAQGPVYVDVTARSKVDFRSQPSATPRKYLPETMLGGVAVLDYDNDGFLDIFFVNGAALRDPMPAAGEPDKSDRRYWNRLYRNNRDGSFSDVTGKAGVRGRGYGMGAAAADYDNDGDTDLYVTGYGVNTLYRNNGDGTFTDVTGPAGVGGAGWSTSAAFVDWDRDGQLDLVVARYLKWSFEPDLWCGGHKPGQRAYCHPDHFKPVTHLAFRNRGDGTFLDASRESGIGSAEGKGLGIAINDFNRDGWPDVLIANDSWPQHLFENRKGQFTEVAVALGPAYDDDGRSFAGMGADFADYDNDGWPDIFVNALGNQRYALFRNLRGVFEYASGPAGLGAISLLHSGWGTRFVDYDNDGWKDLFVAQGHVLDNVEITQPNLRYREPLLLARNVGGKFSDVSGTAGEAFRRPLAARGAAFGDWNNDGRFDIAVHVNGGPALLLENAHAGAGHWLIIETVGTKSNRDGIGALVRLETASGREQHAMVSATGSYLSSNDRRAHFGLGGETLVKRIEIRWPSGAVQRLEDVRADQILKVREPAIEPR